jgi:Tfp pilus assembly protein PilV
LEVVVALTILSVTFLSVGWLIISTLTTAAQSKQQATAAGLVEQVDALFQTNVPALTCANAVNYVAGTGSGTATRNGSVGISNGAGANVTNFAVSSTASAAAGGLLPITISVTWRPAVHSTTTQTLTNQLQVQCQ